MAASLNTNAGAIAGNNGLVVTEVGTWDVSWAGGTPAIGNGTLEGTYVKVGKQITANVKLVFGSTTTGGSGEWTFDLPFAAQSAIFVGSWYGNDAGVTFRAGSAYTVTTTTFQCQSADTTGSHVGSANPFTWGSGDNMVATITYIAA